MTTITDKKQYPGEQYLNELITNIEFAARAPVEVVRAMAAELQKRREADSAEPVSQTYKFPVNTPCQDAPAHIWLQTAGVWPENGELSELTWCSHNQHHDDTLYVRADLVNGNYPVTPARLPGGFTIEDAKALHEDLVRSHISQALSGEKMKKNDRDADLRWIHGVIVQAAWFVKASLEQNALSGNSPVAPDGLSTVCAEAYQVVGVMADALGVFGDAAVQKVLDNLSQQKLVHRDVLPFSLPVTPDSWISCSERMPENIPGSCKEYLVFDGLNNKVHHDYWVVPDGDSAPVASFWNHYGAHVTHWMPLPEPPQEVNRG